MSNDLKRRIAQFFATMAIVASAATTANAAHVSADLSRIGGHTWDASFTISADPGQTVEAFSIYFDWTQVSNILVWATPGDWDSLAIQADGGLASDGYYDALALAAGISDPKALGGFIARFDWADAAGPSMLRFTINDPLTFVALESGTAALTSGGGGGTSVPEPTSGLLVALGLLLAAMARSSSNQQRV